MIFLTGGTGLLGIRLLYDLLSAGEHVRALRRSSSDIALVDGIMSFYHQGKDITELKERLEWCEGDLLDVLSLRKHLQGCHQVIHAAAGVSFHPADEDMLYEVNVLGTRYLVDSALELGINRFLHVSSVAAIGRRDGQKVNEETAWKDGPDQSGYAKTKYAAELEVWRGAEEGLDMVIINPSLIVGAGKPGESSAQLFEGIPGRKFYPSGSSNLVDVRDVSRIALALLKDEVKAERYIVHGETISNRRFFTRLSELMGKPVPGRHIADHWLRRAASVTSFFDWLLRRRSPLTKATVQGTLSDFDYDISKLLAKVPGEMISAEESLAYFADYYRSASRS